MKKENRVKKSEEFQRIIHEKHSTGSSCFVVYTSPRAQDHCRIGISVSKKLGNAVVRNRVKRQMRMILMELVNNDTCQYDLIVIAKPEYVRNDYATNKNMLEKQLKKGKII
ncbi:MAG: ribonuclease P protein component [Erysipelotrichaceae bacterium]|nr:ribonuclease P protein component [Erysipelotrichaceae bacterium]